MPAPYGIVDDQIEALIPELKDVANESATRDWLSLQQSSLSEEDKVRTIKKRCRRDWKR